MNEAGLKKKAALVRKALEKAIPDPKIELAFNGPFELLVAVILSAQCTDERVNAVTKKLFKKYKKPESYFQIPIAELEEDIHSTGFFRNKAKSIQGMARAVVTEHGGKVPGTMDALVKLPGVGRKTANVILGECFDTPGIVVDTHVIRVSNRLGLTGNSDPVKIEFDLQKLAPQKEWTRFAHSILLHGRYTCKAKKPLCETCMMTGFCDYFRDNGPGTKE